MNSLSCIIIEDEILAKKSLENLCGKNDLLQLISTFDNGTDALEFLKENPVDLIF